jgi:single-strand DNA-binding protein
VTEVVADEIQFLISRKDGGTAPTQHQSQSNNMTLMGLDEDFHLMADDDIPF